MGCESENIIDARNDAITRHDGGCLGSGRPQAFCLTELANSPFFAIWREISPQTLRPDKQRGEQPPALEQFYVVCPAVVDDKARPGFESWWQEATTDDVLF
jgi:hypothetical protein